MATKIKTNKSNRGRPKKDFSNIKFKKEEGNTKRPRGRPKKEKKIEETVNTKISKHSKDINKLSRENKKIQLEVNNTSFSSKKIWENKKSDNFALGLLIFSMLLFIFSLYKTFYTNNEIKTNIVPNVITNVQINKDINTDNEQAEIELIENEMQEKNIELEKTTDNTKEEVSDHEIINTFYDTVNNKKFSELSNLVDSYLKSSNVYRTYYSNNWLSKFTERLANKKIYLMDIKEINIENKKDGVNHYSYILKYKLNDSNELFKEEREASIITRWEQKFIWSLRCVTVWCSKMPFFNLPKYDK